MTASESMSMSETRSTHKDAISPTYRLVDRLVLFRDASQFGDALIKLLLRVLARGRHGQCIFLNAATLGFERLNGGQRGSVLGLGGGLGLSVCVCVCERDGIENESTTQKSQRKEER